MDNKKPIIMDGAGPFLFKGNKIGILMIHGGGGGTCADLKPLAEDLHTKGGYTIRVPLLPGFGTSPEILKNTRIEDWFLALKEEITTLMHTSDKVFVGGHSMGGLLTLILAADYDFDGIFTISAPAGLQSFLINLVPVFKIFMKYHKVSSEKFRKDKCS